MGETVARRKVKRNVVIAGGITIAVLFLAACANTNSDQAGNVGTPVTSTEGASTPSNDTSTSQSGNAVVSPSASNGGCDASLWSHVYHSYRLHVVDRCKTVTGTVDTVKREDDGDLHIDLAVSSSLVNSVNVSAQHGDLVLEAICVGVVTQTDAVKPCQGVHNNITIPDVGDKIRVTGSYVLDVDHGWMEIHPITSITILGTGMPTQSSFTTPPEEPSSAAPVQAAPSPTVQHVSCSPLTNGGNCYEPGEYCRKADAGMYGVAGDGARIYCTDGHWERV